MKIDLYNIIISLLNIKTKYSNWYGTKYHLTAIFILKKNLRDFLNRSIMQTSNHASDLVLALSADIGLSWRGPEPCAETGILTSS